MKRCEKCNGSGFVKGQNIDEIYETYKFCECVLPKSNDKSYGVVKRLLNKKPKYREDD